MLTKMLFNGWNFWDIYAWSYDSLPRALPSYFRTLELVCDRLNRAVLPGCHVLDAGCGTGNYALELAVRGYRVDAVDGSSTMLARAAAKVDASTLDVTLTRSDLMVPLPFDTASFDAAVCIMVLYALDDPATLLREINRVVRPSGLLILVTPNSRSLVLPSVREVFREYPFWQAISCLGSLLGVGIMNTIINAQFGRKYRSFTALELEDVLYRSNWVVAETGRCYVEDSALIVVARTTL